MNNRWIQWNNNHNKRKKIINLATDGLFNNKFGKIKNAYSSSKTIKKYH